MKLLIGLTAALLLLLVSSARADNDTGQSGSLSRYDPGVMERVLEWRHTNGIPAGFDPYTPTYDGHIAVMNCRDIGKVAEAYLTIEYVESGPYYFYISDCTSTPATIRWMIRNRIAAEIGYAAWERLGIVDGKGAWIEFEVINGE